MMNVPPPARMLADEQGFEIDEKLTMCNGPGRTSVNWIPAMGTEFGFVMVKVISETSPGAIAVGLNDFVITVGRALSGTTSSVPLAGSEFGTPFVEVTLPAGMVLV